MENQHQPENQRLDENEAQGDAMNRPTGNNEKIGETVNQKAVDAAPSYGAAYQNEENDPSKEENNYLARKSDKQATGAINEHSNTFGQTTNERRAGYGDQEDEIANQGDGSENEMLNFDDEELDESALDDNIKPS